MRRGFELTTGNPKHLLLVFHFEVSNFHIKKGNKPIKAP